MNSAHPIDRILASLNGAEDHGDRYEALCPGHDGHDPSLDIKQLDGNGQQKVLLKCGAGCNNEAILKKLGLEWENLSSENGRGPNRNGGNKAKKRGMCLTKVYDYRSPDGKFVKHHTLLRFTSPAEGEAHHLDCLGDH